MLPAHDDSVSLTGCNTSGSRKYQYPYHGQHLGILKGGESEDMGGFIGMEFQRYGRGGSGLCSSLV